jgi:hypothetical protein
MHVGRAKRPARELLAVFLVMANVSTAIVANEIHVSLITTRDARCWWRVTKRQWLQL